MREHTYDIIIVGGGSAGLMAAVAAGRSSQKVLLLDKGDHLGRKLGISGGGRCNVTNNKELDELIRYIPGNGRFLYSAFSLFSNRDIVAFFEGLGIALKEEDNGRMFPVSDKAKTVVDALIGEVRRLGVEIVVHAAVEELVFEEDRVAGVVLKNGRQLSARCVIVAVGGKSVPKTGSTGDGYPWAEAAGHTITTLFPTEVPLTSAEPFIRNRELQGLSLRDVELSVYNEKGRPIVTHRGDMLFTHTGLSGPIALRCSQFVVKQLAKSGASTVELAIDLFPDQTAEEVYAFTLEAAKNEPRKALHNVLGKLLPDRLVPLLLSRADLNPQTTYDHLPKQQWGVLSQMLKRFSVRINGTLSIEEAFVTGGGVNLKEINPSTMESKFKRGLYFCGEVLDIHGYTGGYNITAAFSTGYCAGQAAAQQAQEG